MTFFQNIKEKYNNKTCSLLKQYSREVERLAKTIERANFLQQCRKRRITPAHIKHSTRTMKQLFKQVTTQNDVNKIETNLHKKLITTEIKETHINITYIKRVIATTENNIKNTLKETEWTKYKKEQWNKFYNIRTKIKHTHMSKIRRLTEEKFKKFNFTYNDDWFINNTKIKFEMEQKWLLSLGQKFAIPVDTKNFAPIPLIADIEQWVQNIKDETEKDITRSKIANKITNFRRKLRNSEKEKFILGIYENTKDILRKHRNEITITSADKGNKTVIMYKKDYKEKMNKLLNDKNTYKIINKDPTEKLQSKNNHLITQLFKENNITKHEKIKMTAYASTAPELYGLPKIHKKDIPLRPISSSTNVPCYNLAKYIGQILKNIISTTHNVKNSKELKRKLEGATINDDELMVSFDVISLFTNIPIHLAIKNILNKWLHIKEHTNINKTTFLKILQFVLNENNYFTFDNKIYNQLYGMPMGNPLSPTIADIVLDTLLDDVIEELKLCNINIRFLTKYVDDLFAVINKTDKEIILKTLNTYHKKLQFTIECENNDKIPYLDVNIIRKNGTITTNWYTKPTSSGRLINFHSTQPTKMKINTATNMITKIFNISDKQYQKSNIDKIRNILKKNNYPTHVINNLINNSLNQKEKHKQEDKIKNFHSVPFVPKLTEMRELKNFITDETTTIAYKSNRTLRHIFTNNKTKADKLKINNVVYEIKCEGNENERCDQVYIGTTKRTLGTRIKEHKADVKKGKNATALSLHVKECKHVMNFEEVKILDKEKNENKRYTLESLRIQQKILRTMNTKEDKNNTKLHYSAAMVT